jgi:kumamolisin
VASLLAGGGARAAGPGSFVDLSSTRQVTTAYAPSQIQSAYNFSPLYTRGIDGTGQIIALLEIDKLGWKDVQAFDAAYGLSDPTVQESYVGGNPFPLEHHGETTMDVEWLHALAPGAIIQIYYVNNAESMRKGFADLGAALNLGAAHGAAVFSISLGTCGPTHGYKVTASALSDMVQSGGTVFVSSGDDGDHPGTVHDCGPNAGVAYPGGDPSVVAVGGTTLHLNADNSIASELAWRQSGGGQATLLKRPVWQVAPQIPHDRFRWVPDVSFLADPRTGVSVYINGGWHQAGGTSLGAPCWAAAWALIRENAQRAGKVVGVAPSILYGLGNSASYHRVFHDVTGGTNGLYHAGAGWDAVTGWGTPDVAALAAAIKALPSQ